MKEDIKQNNKNVTNEPYNIKLLNNAIDRWFPFLENEEKIVILILCLRCYDESIQEYFITFQELCKITCLSENAVKKALKKLEEYQVVNLPEDTSIKCKCKNCLV